MKNKKRLFRLSLIAMIFLGMAASSSVLAASTGWEISSLNTPFNLPDADAVEIIDNLATWLVGIFGFFGIIGFIVSGIMYLVSTGNDEMITKAKKYMMYSLVGVVVGLSGFVVIKAIDAFLNASL